MRIVSGKYRGMVLAEFKGAEIRPTADRVKESLFNILAFHLPESRVLDLFCGSGNLAIESLSRGAAFAHLNDISKDSLIVAKKNLSRLKGENYQVTNKDYLACLKETKDCYEVIFIDPPYRFDFGIPALQVIAERQLISKDGIIVYERDRAFEGKVEGLEQYDERKYGKTYLTFFRWEEV